MANPKRKNSERKNTMFREDEIVERLARGEPMAVICRSPNYPNHQTVRKWTLENPAFAARIRDAREAGFDEIAADALCIADDRTSGEDVNRAKLRIETRLKLLAKWDPKRYGDRVHNEVSGPGGGPIETRALPDETLRARINELLTKFQGAA